MNALDVEFIFELLSAIDDAKKPVIFTSAAKMFSCGGDVLSVVSKKVSPQVAFTSSASSLYRFNQSYYDNISVLEGVTVGGGLCIAMGCKYRLLTSKAMLGMPEVTIGLLPDGGANHFLKSLRSDELKLYLTMTGNLLNGEDSYFGGFSEYYVKNLNGNDKKCILEDGIDTIRRISTCPDSLKNGLLRDLPLIQACFQSGFDLETICCKLSTANTPQSLNILKKIQDNCPLSMRLAYECHKRAATMSHYDIINMEYNVSVKIAEMQNSNFLIGTTHKLLKKAKGRPMWIPSSISEISEGQVQKFFEDQPFELIEYKL